MTGRHVPPVTITARGPLGFAKREHCRSQPGALKALALLWAALSFDAAVAAGETRTHLARSQLLYVPIYSEIAYGDRRHTLNLSATVTVRNTDRKNPVKITRVDYFDTAGRFVRSYLDEPRLLAPMAATDYVISGADRSGGTAASFLIAWESAEAVSPPHIETVMIGAAATTGISFSSTAEILEERP
ncbi:DUF3124 domain-containing protein [Methylotetracoccus oryzae]|uniref:DUF3124 domain-containing protein n=1 Tax=Methylotetracoccus oryzae TaxID=1919059 RepID=UPI0013A5A53F|nr:DUF3124 domain-containing protein [Methylotetracoccus oryzae]